MEQGRLERQLAFLTQIDRMKNVFRQTRIADASRYENDAEHSWHLTVCASVLAEYAPPGTDTARALLMTAVHDLVEIYAGDTYAYDAPGNATKEARERAAADRLYAQLPAEQGAYYRALWEEFDRMETADARWANVCDRLQPLLLNLSDPEGRSWREHGARRSWVERRTEIIGEVSPALGDWVAARLDEAVARGSLRGD